MDDVQRTGSDGEASGKRDQPSETPPLRGGVLSPNLEPDPSDLFRCIFGNPFRPAVSIDPEWLTSTVAALAQGIYADNAFDRLPFLADALQDAGCDHSDILNHCREPNTHGRGCWVVGALLGKG